MKNKIVRPGDDGNKKTGRKNKFLRAEEHIRNKRTRRKDNKNKIKIFAKK